ncbi:MAG: hypothetical protein IPK53_11050 [bacterium]|nr:hypothetical protein [bacterium]
MNHYRDLIRQFVARVSPDTDAQIVAAFKWLVENLLSSEERSLARDFQRHHQEDYFAMQDLENGEGNQSSKTTCPGHKDQIGGPISLTEVRQKVEYYLVALGINPAGPDSALQEYEIVGQDKPVTWAAIYNFDLPQPRLRNNLGPEPQEHYSKMQRKLLQRITEVLRLTGMQGNFEHLGLGYCNVAPPHNFQELCRGLSPDLILQSCNATIHFRGKVSFSRHLRN